MSNPRADRRLRLLLILLLIPCYAADLASDRLTHGDEAYWIGAGYRSSALLLAGHLSGPEWQTGSMASVLDLDHPVETAANRNPKLGALLIGLGIRWLDAPPPPRWQKDYAFGKSPDWNRRHGLLPSRATLLAGRLPVALLSGLAALWFFSLLRGQLSPAFACLGALALATSPLAMGLCRRAMLDGPAYAFSIGAMLWTVRAARSPERWAPALMAGLLAGCAVSSKLNAGVLVPVLALVFASEALLQRSARPLLQAAVVGALATGLLFALNPTLYVAPLEGLQSMLQIGRELEGLDAYFPEHALPALPDRMAAAYQILLVDGGVFGSRLSLPLDPLLLLGGVGWLFLRARRDTAARVLLLWLAVAGIAVCVWPPMRWERYFLPALAPIVATELVGLSAVLSWRPRRRRSHSIASPTRPSASRQAVPDSGTIVTLVPGALVRPKKCRSRDGAVPVIQSRLATPTASAASVTVAISS